MFPVVLVNVGDYLNAVCDRNLAENISRVLYPNDNVSASEREKVNGFLQFFSLQPFFKMEPTILSLQSTQRSSFYFENNQKA